MKNLYTRQILNSEQLRVVKDALVCANENNYWHNGLNSGGGTSGVKNNLELCDANLSKIINDLIMGSLDSDQKFIDFTAAKSTNLNIVSKTISGGYYNPHYDNWMNGHFSTTVFLNDPDEYIGGELCLYFGGEDEVKIKLKSGWGVTYPTGVLHRVNKVISGCRYVSVFWTETLIKDSFMRNIYSEIGEIQQSILKHNTSVHLSDCINASKDPNFLLQNLKNEILRNYSTK